MKELSRSSLGFGKVSVLSLTVALSAGAVWMFPFWRSSDLPILPTAVPPRTHADKAVQPPPSVPAELRPRSAPQLQYVLRQLQRSRDATRPVRILFYGQSITEQGWWKIVETHLRQTYPLAALTIENRAIGGHPAALLMKTAEADLYPFQPDLVIFHVYGSHKDYEHIIKAIRARTTADIIIASDHVTLDRHIDEETYPARLTARDWLYRIPSIVSRDQKSDNWTAWFNLNFLPRVAHRYSAQLVPVRDVWKAYLRTNHLSASSLLRDDVHLNEQGQLLMAEIVKGYLNPSLADAKAPDDGRLVEITVTPPEGFGQNLRIPFYGTRVEVLRNGTAMLDASILINGKAPCSWPETYHFDRTTTIPGSNWPAVLRVQKGSKQLVSETWTATVETSDADRREFLFAVRGSVTGADGQGSSLKRFVSPSGRVVIDPEDWNLEYGHKVIKSDLPRPFPISWHASCLGADMLPAAPRSPNPLAPITVAQGLGPGRHILELGPRAAGSVSTVRVYKPLVDDPSKH